MNEPGLIRIEEARKILQISGGTLKKWRKDGTLPADIHVGKIVRYSKQSIENFINKQNDNSKRG